MPYTALKIFKEKKKKKMCLKWPDVLSPQMSGLQA